MAIISYAQNYEDVLLNRLFPECGDGFYIDVGACHPVVHSVTKLFYERGWHGINIEPIPRLSEMLTLERQRDITLRVGLSNREGTLTLHECLTSMELSTFSEEQAEDLRRRGFELVQHAIPVTTLARVCEQHVERTIDFLKIDVESYEREVLEGADWGRFRPRVVLVEATRPGSSIPSYDHWEPILLAADYLFAFFDGLNRYYVRAEDRQLLPVISVPANVFDEFQTFEYHQQIQELRHSLEASQESRGRTQTALEGAKAALEQAQDALTGTRRALDDSRAALHELRTQSDATAAQLEATQAELGATQAELGATQAELGATQAEFVATQAELRATQVQLAPFQELGPIAIGVARRLRRMSRRLPGLASVAKRIICRAHPFARALVPRW